MKNGRAVKNESTEVAAMKMKVLILPCGFLYETTGL